MFTQFQWSRFFLPRVLPLSCAIPSGFVHCPSEKITRKFDDFPSSKAPLIDIYRDKWEKSQPSRFYDRRLHLPNLARLKSAGKPQPFGHLPDICVSMILGSPFEGGKFMVIPLESDGIA